MKSAPWVSVVMGVYNVAPYVEAAVHSALQQTLQEIEVIVVDDGSTDETTAIVGRIDDPRLRFIGRAHFGAAATLNAGVAQARAPFIAFLDGDDVWLPHRLAQHFEFMKANPGADLSFSLSRLIGEDSSDLGITSRPASGPVRFEDLLVDNRIGNGSAVMVRRASLAEVGAFDEGLTGAYDLDVWLRLALRRADCVYCIPEVLTCYRRRPGQITQNWRLMSDNWLKVLDRYRRQHPTRVVPLEARARCNLYRYLAAAAYEGGEFRAGLGLMGYSLRADPGLFLSTPRSYLISAGLLAGILLPIPLRAQLEAAFLSIWRRLT
ncbi:glycosyltransferase [uncultured Paludibaculum sp.]|uniref:glycosyltransferase family 2 protein n=1 Tax=uncultured Paludibaculum sp. TaxID=1765020 RepID=UPI002AAACCFC|nr:glycosyltransferase [uncultured Paludibaculum sp.]